MNKIDFEQLKGRKAAEPEPVSRPCNQSAADFYEANKHRLPGLMPPPKCPEIPKHIPGGPGTELKKLLHRIKIKPGDCQCDGHARQMDQWGPDGCRENMNTILDWLKAAAKKRKLPFSRTIARRVVLHAISQAERR